MSFTKTPGGTRGARGPVGANALEQQPAAGHEDNVTSGYFGGLFWARWHVPPRRPFGHHAIGLGTASPDHVSS